MSGFPLPSLPCALWLASAALPATAELPTGDSAAFRAPLPERDVDVVAAAPAQRWAGAAAFPRLSSSFGYRKDPFRGGRAIHAGIDIPGPLGASVQAAGSGVVRFAGSAPGYGKLVEIDHGNGLRTRYAHLLRILVPAGAAVMPGEAIALMGSTGRSTGNHLHFEVHANGRAVDPIPYLDGDPARVDVVSAAAPAPHVSVFARARNGAGPARGDGL